MTAPPAKPARTFDFSKAVPAGVLVRRKGKATCMGRNGLIAACPPDTQRIDHGTDTKKPAP